MLSGYYGRELKIAPCFLRRLEMTKNKVICVVAGKSGGHIIPGMTYVHNFTKAHPNYDVLFFSTDSQLDRSIIALYPYVFSYVPLKMMGIPG